MAVYDANIIQQFVDRLYRKAQIAVALYTSIGAVIGFIVIFVPITYFGFSSGYVEGTGGATLLGMLGFWLGRERTFKLKLRAQLILCQTQIEKNTR